jgi:hypothetical protein
MATSTTYRDNEQTQCREAWQNGKMAYLWTRQEIDSMHAESPATVLAWGMIPHWKKSKSSNVELRGGPLADGPA